MLNDPRRIIVSRTDRIGDVVLSLPVFASLKKCFPDSELTAFVSEYTSDVVSSFPAVDGVTIYDSGESLLTTVRKLKRLRADAILFLYPRLRLSAAAFIAGIPVRVGTTYRWYSFLFNNKVREHRKESLKSEAEYNLTIARAIGCDAAVMETRLDIESEDQEKVKAFLLRKRIEKFVVIHPGSRGSAADWSPDNFHLLCRAIREDSDIDILVTGSESEIELCDKVAAGVENCTGVAGVFTLREFIALLSMACLFVSNSTGPIHLAACVGTPVVGIYPNNKPMTPARWAPLTDRKTIVTPPDGSDDLAKVSAEKVFRSVRRMLTVNAG